MKNPYHLSEEEYLAMVTSEYVLDYLNPEEIGQHKALDLLKELTNPSKFVVKEGVGYWIKSAEGGEEALEPVPLSVAQYARFLNMLVDLPKHKQALA